MYKKFYFFLITILLLFTLASCGKQPYVLDAYAIVYEDKIPYLINGVEEKFSLSKYDYIVDDFNEYITVGKYKNGILLYGLIKKNGEEIIKPKYLWASVVRENKIVVTAKKQQQILNTNGKTLYKFPENVKSSSYFSDGFLLVEKDGKNTYMTDTFEILDYHFDYATPFKNGFACVGIIKDNQMKYGFLNTDGTMLEVDGESYPFDFVDSFENDLARVGFLNDAPSISATVGVNDYKFNYLKKDGSFLLADNKVENNGKSYTLEYAQNFSSDGIALIGYYQMIKESTFSVEKPYIQYFFIDTNGKIASTRINEGGMTGDSYFPGMAVCGVFRCRKRAVGAGAWKIYLTIFDEEKNIYTIDEFTDTDLTRNSTLSNTPPTEMTDFRISAYYYDSISIAKIRIANGKFGMINSAGSLVLDVKYDKIIY